MVPGIRGLGSKEERLKGWKRGVILHFPALFSLSFFDLYLCLFLCSIPYPNRGTQSIASQMGTAGVVHTSLSGVKSYD